MSGARDTRPGDTKGGDATFEDGAEKPLYLAALDGDDLGIMSALVQDAVFTMADMTYRAKRREFAILINRFRWEDRDAAARGGRGFERVRAILRFGDVLAVQSQGIDRAEADTVLSVLSLAFEPGADGMGRVVITLAGDGALGLQVEALDVVLRDVTRPYLAPSRRMPDHGV